jgi:hypothetical protein
MKYKCIALIKAPNGNIIIFGGVVSIVGNDYAKPTPDIAVLNTTSYEWSAPKVHTNIGEFPSLSSHSSNLIKDYYMIVSFGK